MECIILMDFPFSTDGINQIQATKGETRDDIPTALHPGLVREGYIEFKSAGAAPENKALGATPENKDQLAALRTEYQEVVGKRPFMGWDQDELERRIAEARG